MWHLVRRATGASAQRCIYPSVTRCHAACCAATPTLRMRASAPVAQHSSAASRCARGSAVYAHGRPKPLRGERGPGRGWAMRQAAPGSSSSSLPTLFPYQTCSTAPKPSPQLIQASLALPIGSPSPPQPTTLQPPPTTPTAHRTPPAAPHPTTPRHHHFHHPHRIPPPPSPEAGPAQQEQGAQAGAQQAQQEVQLPPGLGRQACLYCIHHLWQQKDQADWEGSGSGCSLSKGHDSRAPTCQRLGTLVARPMPRPPSAHASN